MPYSYLFYGIFKITVNYRFNFLNFHRQQKKLLLNYYSSYTLIIDYCIAYYAILFQNTSCSLVSLV